MAEVISIIASILGIAGFVWAIIKFIFSPYIKRKRDYKDVINTIEEHFGKWKEVGYSLHGSSFIKYEDFLEINKFRHRLLKMDKEKISFLLRNAVQNGMGGEWGHWLVINSDNEKIIPALILALNGTAGYRPIWRSAYILEKTFENSINHIFRQLDPNMKENENVKYAFEVMNTTGVKKYLQNVTRSTQGKLRTKAQRVLQEIEKFSEKINQYADKQTISKLTLESHGAEESL